MPSFRFPFFYLSPDYLESTMLRTTYMHGWQKIGVISQAFAPIVSVLANPVASDYMLCCSKAVRNGAGRVWSMELVTIL
jgi:hypothetical protein